MFFSVTYVGSEIRCGYCTYFILGVRQGWCLVHYTDIIIRCTARMVCSTLYKFSSGVRQGLNVQILLSGVRKGWFVVHYTDIIIRCTARMGCKKILSGVRKGWCVVHCTDYLSGVRQGLGVRKYYQVYGRIECTLYRYYYQVYGKDGVYTVQILLSGVR